MTVATCQECRGHGTRNYVIDGQRFTNCLCEQCGGAGTVNECDVCGGTGLINSETGTPTTNAEAWRSDVAQCATCDGMGIVYEDAA